MIAAGDGGGDGGGGGAGEFEYGNARVRARRARLLGRRAYDELLGKDLDSVLATLAQTTPYRRDIEATLPRFRGIRRLHEALRTHVARELAEVRGFYDGRAREALDLLLARVERRDLLTLLRGQARHAPVDEVLALLVPTPALDEALLRELAGEPGLRPAIERLVVSGRPHADVARALLAAHAAYERAGDLAVLERALARAFAARAGRTLASLPAAYGPLERVLGAEADRANLILALRLRRATERRELPAARPEDDPDRFLPGGRLPRAVLDAAADAEAPLDAALGALPPTPAAAALRAPLAAYLRDRDLTALEDALERGLLAEAAAFFRTEDPLGPAIPVAYVLALEAEARNLRLVGLAAEGGLRPEEARARLVFADAA